MSFPPARPSRPAATLLAGVLGFAAVHSPGAAQTQEHGRKYKAPPPTAHLVVTVEKGFNGKPLPNAAVVFHAIREGKDDGNLEIKTDPDGQGVMDLLDIGSHVTVQVIATGFATYATEFDLDSSKKDLLVKMQRPRAQVSRYEDNDGKASMMQPGIQEPHHELAPAARTGEGLHSATVSGTVTDPAGMTIPGALVTIRDLTGHDAPVTLSTGNDGKFRRTGLEPATYEIVVAASGYTTKTHTGVALSRGDDQIFDDQLMPAAAPGQGAVVPPSAHPQ